MNSVPFGALFVPLRPIVLLPPVWTVPPKPNADPLPVITTLAIITSAPAPVLTPVPFAVMLLSLTANTVGLAPSVAVMPEPVQDENELL